MGQRARGAAPGHGQIAYRKMNSACGSADVDADDERDNKGSPKGTAGGALVRS